MVGDIDRIGLCCIRPRAINFVRGFLCVGPGSADGGNPRAFTGQTDGNGVPNSPPCTSDDGDLTFESHTLGMICCGPLENKERNTIKKSFTRSKREDAQKRDFDRERFLDVSPEVIPHFFEPAKPAKNF